MYIMHRNKSISNIFLLKAIIQSNCDVFFPKELLQYIMELYHNNISYYSVKVSCGMYHTIVVDSIGNLYSYGSNIYGECGSTETYFQLKLTDVKNVVSVSSGLYNTVAVTMDGKLYSCGQNDVGQAGLGNLIKCPKFTLICDKNVVLVSCGPRHTMIVTLNGDLYACGINEHGQLGLSNVFYRIPTLVPIKNVVSVSCGTSHTMVITSNGDLYACGSNEYGQLGLGNNKSCNVFTKVPITNVVSISCGNNHTMMLTANGNLYACGLNLYGQLGLGGSNNCNKFTFTQVLIENVIYVRCKDNCTMIITKGDKLYTCGYNSKYNKFDLIPIEDALVLDYGCEFVKIMTKNGCLYTYKIHDRTISKNVEVLTNY